ncbi:serine/threonine-protein kinase [Candidatus Uabimicrobium amorphum]|uniref:Protein kinase n=2 Tax=Uabimicrobium amorphum TaxID=2596890 RepID=A0A5S9ISW0_UABAM|nr:protein kinase [Candidatus Uabimicrobium amorphum]
MEKRKNMGDLLGLGLSDSFEISDSNVEASQFQQQFTIKPGQQIKQYSIIDKLGEGGMGVVYKAFDNHLQREVAIKILCGNKDFNKLLKEAKSIAQLNHPNIVQVYEVCDTYPYFFAMEFIDGVSLDQFIQQYGKKFQKQNYYREIAKIFSLVAIALGFAHKRGIIHRDLKPENIMLDSNLQPKVMDFGIAQVMNDKRETAEDNFAGTPMYMSPQQVKGVKLDKTTDIYSLGATLYEAITSREPFQGDSALNIMFQIVHSDPLVPRTINPEIPMDLQSICLKCLQKAPQRRYHSMRLLAKDLQNFLQLKPIAAKPPRKIEIVYKWMLRNKLTTMIALGCVSIIVLLSTYYIHNLKQALQKISTALHAKEEAQRERNYYLIGRYYEMVNRSVQQKEFSAAQRDLLELTNAYSQAKLGDAQQYLEYRFFKNKVAPYTEKLIADFGKETKIYHVGSTLLTVDGHGVIALHDKQRGMLKKKKEVHDVQAAYDSALSKDKKYIVLLCKKRLTVGSNYCLYIYDTTTLKKIVSQKLINTHKREYSLCRFYDEKSIVVAGKTIDLWQWRGKNVYEKYSHTSLSKETNHDMYNKVTSLDIHRVNKKLIFVYSGLLYEYSFTDDRLKKIPCMPDKYKVFCRYDQRQNVLFATHDGKMYRLNKRGEIIEFEKKDHFEINKIICRKDYIFASSKQGLIHIWNSTGKIYRTIATDVEPLHDFSVNKSRIFTNNMRLVYVYAMTPQENPFVVEEKKNYKYVSLAKDHFVYGDGFLKIVTRDLRTSTMQTTAYQSSYATYVPESGELCILAGALDTYQPVRYQKIDFRETYRQKSSQQFFRRFINGFIYRSSQKLYVYNKAAATTVWNLRTRDLLNETSAIERKSSVVSAALSPDERYMAFTFQRGSSIVVSDLQTKKKYSATIGFDVHRESKITFAVLQQKTYLILAIGSKIFVYDFDKLLQKQTQNVCMQKYKDSITSFTVVSGERLISMDSRGRVIVWNLANIEQSNLDRFLCELRGESAQIINDCVYSKKYNKLITVGSQVLIWDFN